MYLFLEEGGGLIESAGGLLDGGFWVLMVGHALAFLERAGDHAIIFDL